MPTATADRRATLACPAGWYADPTAAGRLRFWNGEQWKEARLHPPPSFATRSLLVGAWVAAVVALLLAVALGLRLIGLPFV